MSVARVHPCGPTFHLSVLRDYPLKLLKPLPAESKPPLLLSMADSSFISTATSSSTTQSDADFLRHTSAKHKAPFDLECLNLLSAEVKVLLSVLAGIEETSNLSCYYFTLNRTY